MSPAAFQTTCGYVVVHVWPPLHAHIALKLLTRLPPGIMLLRRSYRRGTLFEIRAPTTPSRGHAQATWGCNEILPSSQSDKSHSRAFPPESALGTNCVVRRLDTNRVLAVRIKDIAKTTLHATLFASVTVNDDLEEFSQLMSELTGSTVLSSRVASFL